MSIFETCLVLYLFGFVFTLIMAFAVWDESRRSRQFGARIALLSPIWPVPLAYAVWVGIRQLLTIADWKGNE